MSEVIDHIRRGGHWPPEASDDQVWADSLRHYQSCQRHERKMVMDNMRDRHLPAEGVRLSHDAADALMRLRQLEDIDRQLWAAGR
jgi:hypothetical protein